MSDMFCFQCQQTAGNKCCVSVGVCGKQPDTAALQDELVYELIRLAEAAAAAGQRTQIADRLLMEGGRWSAAQVKEAFQRDSLREFTDPFRRAVVQARETLNGGNDPQLADFVLDRAYFGGDGPRGGQPLPGGVCAAAHRRRQPALRRPVCPYGEGERLFEPGTPARGKCGGPRAHVRQGQ